MKNAITGIDDYIAKPADYSEQIDAVGLCEIQGRRDNQQDAIAVSNLDLSSFLTLNAAEQSHVLKKTVADMQRYYGHVQLSGSTVCCVLTVLDPLTHIFHAWVVNLGDSAAYLVVLDENNILNKTARLNPVHNPNPYTNVKEYTRVSTYAEPSFHHGDWRMGNLAVSRSIGDTLHESIGLSHEPEVFGITQEIADQRSLYLIVACDGLQTLMKTSSDGALALEQLGTCIAHDAKMDASTEVMAINLVKTAYEKESTDNISVAVIKVGHQFNSALVADGHGDAGEEIARAIADNFYPRLAQHIVDCQQKKFLATQPFSLLKERIQAAIIEWLMASKLTFNQVNNILYDWALMLADNSLFFPEIFIGSGESQSLTALIADYDRYSDTEKRQLTSEVLSALNGQFTEKSDAFLRLAMRLDRQIAQVRTHIHAQPASGSRFSFLPNHYLGPKKKLLQNLEALSFHYLDVPISAFLSAYDKRPELSYALQAYEQALHDKQLTTHVALFKAFKTQLASSSKIPYTADEIAAYKKRLQPSCTDHYESSRLRASMTWRVYS